ncbi:DNA helicase UvrD [Pelagibacterium lacus]|uniref:DNA 3'-5' helicase n=2 Tax=Pelagibacterium lacus TaxID=2282655 RepID=A0A369W0Q9_9HYPH|nr:DNA helicase UvrD [Pelagibacterium lacus]
MGVEVIRGAAGSGKTSTAILRLRSLAYMLEARFEREEIRRPVRILVLTFNRTLSGYVHQLAQDQLRRIPNSTITVDTFGRWAMSHLDYPNVVDEQEAQTQLESLAQGLPLAQSYVAKEVEYLLGRFEPSNIEAYIATERTGRGAQPRIDQGLRRQILDQVTYPYLEWLRRRDALDWNGVAVSMAQSRQKLGYDVAIVDESQDFSANQLRALRQHLAGDFAATFVVDTVQRIYARGFTWAETGFDMRQAVYHRLRENHRNTIEIAQFASGLLEGIEVEDDGSLPDLTKAKTRGTQPTVLKGYYRDQVGWVFDNILSVVDPKSETVAFLAPKGGGYLRWLKEKLRSKGYDYVDITRNPDWPEGDEFIAISTFHSAKGLEFDHVVILGLGSQNTDHDDPDLDDQLSVWRRLLAVAVARARRSVTIGYKPGEQSDLVQFFKMGSFAEIRV